MAWLSAILLCVIFVTQAQAQPGWPRPGDREAKPRANVITRVNLKVDTDVDVVAGPAASSASDDEEEQEDDDEENDDEDDSATLLKDLTDSVLGNASSGPSINIITDLNISVQTRVRVRAHKAIAGKPSAASATDQIDAAKQEKEKETARDADETSEMPRKKGRMKKRPRKQALEESDVKQEAEAPSSYSLRELRVDDRVRFNVARPFPSNQEATRQAEQINGKTRQALLGLAILGAALPEEQESLGVLREAVGSVQAQATGGEVSISAAIPWSTIGAVRNLVVAAKEQW